MNLSNKILLAAASSVALLGATNASACSTTVNLVNATGANIEIVRYGTTLAGKGTVGKIQMKKRTLILTAGSQAAVVLPTSRKKKKTFKVSARYFSHATGKTTWAHSGDSKCPQGHKITFR